MFDSTFLVIDDESISSEQALNCLQLGGELNHFLLVILRQHILSKALQQHPHLQISDSVIEQVLTEFRQTNQLHNDSTFQVWLANYKLTEDRLYQQIANNELLIRDWQLKQLKELVTQPNLQAYFFHRHHACDRFQLSWLVLEHQGLAEELFDRITEQEASFAEIFQEYFLSSDPEQHVWQQVMLREQIPKDLQDMLKAPRSGELLKPFAIDQAWCLLRIDEFTAASLNHEGLEARLKDELFEQWLMTQIEPMTVKLQVTRWLQLQ